MEICNSVVDVAVDALLKKCLRCHLLGHAVTVRERDIMVGREPGGLYMGRKPRDQVRALSLVSRGTGITP